MSLQLALDLIGIFVFALSGGLVGVRRQLDVFGVLVLAAVTGLGGGVIRDVLIGSTPPAALREWWYVAVTVVAGLITFGWSPGITRLGRLVRIFDAAGLGLFCVTGTTTALRFGLGPLPAALLGMLTAIGGGVLRDLLAGEVPAVLQRELYAVPALVGAAIVVVADEVDLNEPYVPVAAAIVAFAYRLVAVRRDWNAPLPRVGHHRLRE